MHSRSFLHPDYAYKISHVPNKQKDLIVQAPDIFVVPPEEDQTPPWCCYNSQQGWSDEDGEENTLRIPQASSHTPFFYRDVAGIEALLPVRKGSAEARSIVDALGDADDFSDHEYDHYRHIEMDPMDDGFLPEMDTDYRYTRHCQHHPPESQVRLRSPRPEVDNDSDIVEIIKVRKKSTFTDDSENHLWTSSDRIANKSTLRSRATKVFQILRGNIQTSSKTGFKPRDLDGSSSNFVSHGPLGSRPKLQRPRAQDVFSPTEDAIQSERSHTSERQRPAGRLFGSALKRRASTASFITSILNSSTPTLQTQESPTSPQQKYDVRPSDGFRTLPGRSLSSIQNSAPSVGKDIPIPTPAGDHFQQRQSGDGGSTPSSRTFKTRDATSLDQSRSTSPTSSSRTEIPLPGSRLAKRGFSVLNLRKIFQKPASQPSPEVIPQSMHQTSYGSPTCPSLSSAPTSEWSGRTSPTTDSVPQTPTSFDENEVRRTIVPVQSSSTVGSGISLGSSLQSGAVSYLSFDSVSSEATAATPGHGLERLEDTSSEPRAICHSSLTNGPISEILRPSMASSHSTMSLNTACGKRSSISGRKNESIISSPVEAPSELPFDMSCHLDLDLNLGLGIDMVPSPSGGMLSLNGMDKTTAPDNVFRKVRGRANLSRSLSLKSLGNKLGIRKQDDPPAPRLPKRVSDDEDFEMRLDSLHFEDMSFDANTFIAR